MVNAPFGIHGIFVNVTRRHEGRVVSLKRIRTVLQKNADTPNLIADKELGNWPNIPEKCRHAQVFWYQGRVDVSTYSAPKRVCVRSSPGLGPFSLPGGLRARHVPAKL
jgi:hypothetical protein